MGKANVYLKLVCSFQNEGSCGLVLSYFTIHNNLGRTLYVWRYRFFSFLCLMQDLMTWTFLTW